MFCKYCGKEISNDANFCTECGIRVNEEITNQYGYVCNAKINAQDLLNQLSERIKTNAIIWLVIAIIQLLIGLHIKFIFTIGLLNLVSSIFDLFYSERILQKPVGIISTLKPLVLPIIVLIYNIVFGGIIGVVGSIYYFVAIRGFVMENERMFRQIEENHSRLL